MALTFDELCIISKDFYDIFEPEIETNKTFKLKIELGKYVAHAKFSHDVVHNDCKLTFEEWAKKYKIIYGT